MTTPRDDFVGELRLGKALTSIVQIVALALNIGLGLIVFYSSIILPEVNENPILLVLATAIALGLTLLNLVELIAGSGDWGGTYQIVYEILHRSLSFLTGWAILLASLALGAALALLAAELINGIFLIETPASWTAVGLLILLLVIQLFQFLPRRIQGWVFASLFSVIIVASLLTQSEEVGAAQLSAARTIAPQPATAFLTTAALICGAYAVFEAILSVRRQARNSSRLLPRSIFYTYLLWLGLAILAFMEFGRHTASIGHGEQFLIDLVRSYSFLPEFIGIALILLLLLIASHGLLMLAARQISGLVRTGGLPTWMREVRRPFPLPIFMFLAMGLILIPLTLLGEELSLAFLGSALFLFAMVILNIAAIRSHRSEPNRRRTINIPFPPLVPALAVGANLILLPYIPGTVLIVAAAWLAVGVALYFGYARSRLVEVKIVTSTFGRMAEMDENEYFYRILVPIGPGTERHFVLNTAITMARQVNGEVLPLQVVTLSDPLAIEEGRRTARERNTLFSWSIREAKNLGVPVFPITRLSRNVYDGILETAEEERINLILIPWAVKERFQSVRIGQSISQVVRRAPCDVAVLAYHPEAIGDEANASGEAAEDHDAQEADGAEKSGTNGFRRILIPTSGGPNAPLAVQIAVTLALETEARVTAVYITTRGATEEELTEGKRRIESTIDTMIEAAQTIDSGERLSNFQNYAIDGKVIQADSIVSGITENAGEQDLILLGVSEESVIDQVLFGTIPEQVASESAAPVMLVKRYRGLPRMWLNRFVQSIFRSFPKLTIEEQIDVYRNIHRGSRPSIDFFIMIGLSAMIATFGLFLNSTAVIIGAMLVAPLFSPIIGLGLSTTLGNVRLLRLAIEATLKGMALAVAIAAIVTIFSRSEGLTTEILSRTQPSLLDLAVALASGAAGAYAMARKDVATALPGVAIAAALVPPLCVVGIGMAFGDPQVTFGSLLLFLTNLVSIVLAGSVVFLLLGFRPGGEHLREYHFQRALIVTITLFILILIPLGVFFIQSASQTQFRTQIEGIVAQEVDKFNDIELAPWQEIIIAREEDRVSVNVPILAGGDSVEEFVSGLSAELNSNSDIEVVVRAMVVPVIEGP